MDSGELPDRWTQVCFLSYMLRELHLNDYECIWEFLRESAARRAFIPTVWSMPCDQEVKPLSANHSQVTNPQPFPQSAGELVLCLLNSLRVPA